jgi:transposase-like protein
MSKQSRRFFTAQEKVAIVRQVLLEKRPVSEVCEEQRLQPTLYYAWQRQFFENGAAAFEKDKPSQAPGQRLLERQIEKLENKVRQQQEVIAEVTGEYVQLKKASGGA